MQYKGHIYIPELTLAAWFVLPTIAAAAQVVFKKQIAILESSGDLNSVFESLTNPLLNHN